MWTTDPSHPIARGVANPIVIEKQEMYGEPFAIPHPDEVVFLFRGRVLEQAPAA